MEIFFKGKIIDEVQLESGKVAKGNTITFTSGKFSNLDDNHTYQVKYLNEFLNLEITKYQQIITKDNVSKILFEAKIF